MKKLIYSLALVILLSSCSKEDSIDDGATPSAQHPVSLTLESIVIDGFDTEVYSGENNPDIYVHVTVDGSLLYISEVVGNIEATGAYSMSDGQSGSLPITAVEDQWIRIDLRDNEGSGAFQNMGRIEINYNHLYKGDQATSFSDVRFIEGLGYSEANFLLSGTFNY